MKLGVSTWLWGAPLDLRFAERIFPVIREIGYQGVEIPADDPSLLEVSPLLSLLEKNNLEATLCGSYGPGRDLSHPDESVRISTHRYIDQCLELCEALHVPVFSGPLYSEVGIKRILSPQEMKSQRSRVVESLHAVCERAHRRGIDIGIEPLNRFETNVVNTTSDLLGLISEIDHPRAKVMLDGFHMTIEEADLREAIVRCGELLAHFQVSENHRGIPGTGLTDWKSIQEGLKEIGYQGWIVLESFTPDHPQLSPAVCLWRKFAENQNLFAKKGYDFLSQTFPSTPQSPLPSFL